MTDFFHRKLITRESLERDMQEWLRAHRFASTALFIVLVLLMQSIWGLIPKSDWLQAVAGGILILSGLGLIAPILKSALKRESRPEAGEAGWLSKGNASLLAYGLFATASGAIIFYALFSE